METSDPMQTPELTPEEIMKLESNPVCQEPIEYIPKHVHKCLNDKDGRIPLFQKKSDECLGCQYEADPQTTTILIDGGFYELEGLKKKNVAQSTKGLATYYAASRKYRKLEDWPYDPKSVPEELIKDGKLQMPEEFLELERIYQCLSDAQIFKEKLIKHFSKIKWAASSSVIATKLLIKVVAYINNVGPNIPHYLRFTKLEEHVLSTVMLHDPYC